MFICVQRMHHHHHYRAKRYLFSKPLQGQCQEIVYTLFLHDFFKGTVSQDFLTSFVMILTYLDSLFIRESIFENDFYIAVNIRVYKNVFHVIFKLFLSPFKETVYQFSTLFHDSNLFGFMG